jgi:hypothetical protein
VVGRNPRLIVRSSTASDSRAVRTKDADLVGRVDLLGAEGRALCAFTSLATSFLLREQGSEPSVVDEIHGASKDTSENEVEEDAVQLNQNTSQKQLPNGDSHLRIKEARGCLDDRNSAIVSLVSVEHAHVVLDRSSQVESQVLGVHLGSKAVRDRLLLASWDQKLVLADSQVADDCGRVGSARDTRGGQKRATNVAKMDGSGLLVDNREDGIGRVAIDQLDAKHLGIREGNRNLDFQLGRLLLSRVFELFDNFGGLFEDVS